MKELKGTKTEQNPQAAFAGESQARNKYTYFASKAKKDGMFGSRRFLRRRPRTRRSTRRSGTSC